MFTLEKCGTEDIRLYTEPEVYIISKSEPIQENIKAYCKTYGYPIKPYKNTTDTLELIGRHCYLSFPNSDENSSKPFVEARLKSKHDGILEHSSVTLILRGISRGFTHEMVRHRLFSFMQSSTRYCPPEAFGIILPPSLKNNKDEFLKRCSSQYENYKWALETLPPTLTLKQKRGISRGFLLHFMEAPIAITGNLRTWREMLSKRMVVEAEEEFKVVAKNIKETIVNTLNLV